VKRFFLTALVVAAAIFTFGCGSSLQNAQVYEVNRGSDTLSAYRIDNDSVALHSDLNGEGWTAMLLERCDNGVRYTIEVYMDERICRGSGFFYDSDRGDANFDLRWNGSDLYVTEQMRPFLDRWFEVVDECL